MIESRLVFGPVLHGMGAVSKFDCADALGDFNVRLGHCYELAAKAFYRQGSDAYRKGIHHVPKPRLLVHGSWQGPGAPERINHAWVMLDNGQVWEPITATIFTKDTFYQYTMAQWEVCYNKARTIRNLLEFQHFGPWHD